MIGYKNILLRMNFMVMRSDTQNDQCSSEQKKIEIPEFVIDQGDTEKKKIKISEILSDKSDTEEKDNEENQIVQLEENQQFPENFTDFEKKYFTKELLVRSDSSIFKEVFEKFNTTNEHQVLKGSDDQYYLKIKMDGSNVIKSNDEKNNINPSDNQNESYILISKDGSKKKIFGYENYKVFFDKKTNHAYCPIKLSKELVFTSHKDEKIELTLFSEAFRNSNMFKEIQTGDMNAKEDPLLSRKDILKDVLLNKKMINTFFEKMPADFKKNNKIVLTNIEDKKQEFESMVCLPEEKLKDVIDKIFILKYFLNAVLKEKKAKEQTDNALIKPTDPDFIKGIEAEINRLKKHNLFKKHICINYSLSEFKKFIKQESFKLTPITRAALDQVKDTIQDKMKDIENHTFFKTIKDSLFIQKDLYVDVLKNMYKEKLLFDCGKKVLTYNDLNKDQKDGFNKEFKRFENEIRNWPSIKLKNKIKALIKEATDKKQKKLLERFKNINVFFIASQYFVLFGIVFGLIFAFLRSGKVPLLLIISNIPFALGAIIIVCFIDEWINKKAQEKNEGIYVKLAKLRPLIDIFKKTVVYVDVFKVRSFAGYLFKNENYEIIAVATLYLIFLLSFSQITGIVLNEHFIKIVGLFAGGNFVVIIFNTTFEIKGELKKIHVDPKKEEKDDDNEPKNDNNELSGGDGNDEGSDDDNEGSGDSISGKVDENADTKTEASETEE